MFLTLPFGRKRTVKGYAEASAVVVAYCLANGIGSREWWGPQLFCANGGEIGYVSPNGKVWPGTPMETELTTRPLYMP